MPPGLICLYEPHIPLLLSSDHVLERISPNIGLYARQAGDSLGNYLHSLRLVCTLPVTQMLPGYSIPFPTWPGALLP